MSINHYKSDRLIKESGEFCIHVDKSVLTPDGDSLNSPLRDLPSMCDIVRTLNFEDEDTPVYDSVNVSRHTAIYDQPSTCDVSCFLSLYDDDIMELSSHDQSLMDASFSSFDDSILDDSEEAPSDEFTENLVTTISGCVSSFMWDEEESLKPDFVPLNNTKDTGNYTRDLSSCDKNQHHQDKETASPEETTDRHQHEKISFMCVPDLHPLRFELDEEMSQSTERNC